LRRPPVARVRWAQQRGGQGPPVGVEGAARSTWRRAYAIISVSVRPVGLALNSVGSFELHPQGWRLSWARPTDECRDELVGHAPWPRLRSTSQRDRLHAVSVVIPEDVAGLSRPPGCLRSSADRRVCISGRDPSRNSAPVRVEGDAARCWRRVSTYSSHACRRAAASRPGHCPGSPSSLRSDVSISGHPTRRVGRRLEG
jgi:hypothetical protein